MTTCPACQTNAYSTDEDRCDECGYGPRCAYCGDPIEILDYDPDNRAACSSACRLELLRGA